MRPRSNLRKQAEWLKPSTIISAMALIMTVFVAYNTATKNDAAAAVGLENRITRVENTLQVLVIPSLQRIEKKIDGK